MEMLDSGAKIGGETKVATSYCDGCFDLLHYGHANQVRRAKQMTNVLVVGVHSDEVIAKHKSCLPIFSEDERYQLVRGLKWIDKIIYDAPFTLTVAFLDEIGCQFSIHGDDFSFTADGVHAYAQVKRVDRYVELKRTAGVSTTDLIERILYMQDKSVDSQSIKKYGLNMSPWTRGYPFLASSELLKAFAADQRQRLVEDKVVYVAGNFDVFHAGHLAFLEEAAKLGTYLLVGVHSDSVVKEYKGSKFPVLSLIERVLTVLSYKCVSNVLIGAPYVVTSDLLNEFGVDVVCHGRQGKVDIGGGVDPYEEPKRRGCFRLVDSKCCVTLKTIFERVLSRRKELEARNERKETKERKAYDAVFN